MKLLGSGVIESVSAAGLLGSYPDFSDLGFGFPLWAVLWCLTGVLL